MPSPEPYLNLGVPKALFWKELEIHFRRAQKQCSVVSVVSPCSDFSDGFASSQAWLALNVSSGFLTVAQDCRLFLDL